MVALPPTPPDHLRRKDGSRARRRHGARQQFSGVPKRAHHTQSATARLGFGYNRYQQSIVWQSLPEDLPEDAAAFHFHSADARAECWLVSPSIHLKSGTKLKMQGLFKKSQDFRGSIALIVELTKTTDVTQTDPLRTEYEVIRHFIVKEPNVKRANDWWLAQQTFELPARNVHSVRLRIGGKFKGDVQVRGVRLESPL